MLLPTPTVTNPGRDQHIFQPRSHSRRWRGAWLLTFLLWGSSFSVPAIAQTDPTTTIDETTDVALDPTLDTTPEAPTPRLQPAANTGDLVGDFFSVSVSACTLDPDLLDANNPQTLQERGIISSQLISQTDLSQPSLWWARAKFGQDELIQDWLINPETQQINLIVDRAEWSNLNSIEHYSIVHKFGAIARRHGYELRIFNTQPKCLAIYDCEDIDHGTGCKVDMQPSRRDPFNFF